MQAQEEVARLRSAEEQVGQSPLDTPNDDLLSGMDIGKAIDEMDGR